MSDLISRQTENKFERTINASDLQEWIMTMFPDWCEGDIRLIFDHIDKMPSAQPKKRTEKHTETHACDLISRQSAIDAIVAQTIGYTVDEIKAECEENIFNENGYLGGLKDAIEAIEDMPPVQPERKTGRWLPEYGDVKAKAHYCSVCEFYYTTSPEQMNYCPHCGAQMEKMPPFKVRSSKQTVIEKWQRVFERRHTYCKDCERSIYGKYADCNINIENNGLYVRGNCECRLKVKKEREKTD